MRITLRSKNGAELSSFERKVIKLAANFYAGRLMTNRLSNSLDLRVNIHKGYGKKEKYLADAMPIDDDVTTKRPKKFEVNIDSDMPFKKILISLAHEMVHVKQWAKGELKFHERGNLVTFQKERYDGDEYWESPWEIEAYGREPGLWQKFKPTYKLLLAENRGQV